MTERRFRREPHADPSALRAVFSNTATAPLWMLARLYLGYQWLIAGWDKVAGNDRWIARDGRDGLALKAMWERTTAMPGDGAPAISYDWYRDFLSYMLRHQAYTWFAWVIALGETAIGIALIIGVLTGFAALAGVFLTFNFQLAGAASVNPLLFIVALLIAFGWKVAGWIGVDRWLLPALGAPWRPAYPVKRAIRHPVPDPGIDATWSHA
jgi:thiosulfate dehydrogenase [quinone] large subunit